MRKSTPLTVLTLALLALALLTIEQGWWQQQTAPVGEQSRANGVVDAAANRDQPTLSPGTLSPGTTTAALPAFLPPQAHDTLGLIQRGGPFPYRQDGGVFGNREGHLPRQARGYYREYTVRTPGLRHRGARRIVTGGDPPQVYYYSDDHYNSFRAFEIPR